MRRYEFFISLKNNTLMIMKEDIPNNIKHYIVEIADRLWNGHASIMIGAGFSKNAQKTNTSTKTFPTWNELGDILYERLHANKPNDCDKAYLNVLKLADEVEVAFGKEYLNNLIKRVIPDNEHIPSDIHIKILSLPWKDVFTTNYDTLLERSADLITERRYEIVTNKHDLVWSTSPRIVKLHGSFPSERPFIISGEDYRQYPQKYAPFVNTVQQSLLENTLCLVGFSGDDPNFLNWIGWIRDNLGKENSPKIYLIGILSLSPGQTKLLEERNIISVDLSGYCLDKVDHYEAIDRFITSINSLNSIKVEDWGEKDISYQKDSNKDNYKEVLDQWRKLRQRYPGWLILPSKKRKALIDTTESVWLSQKFISKFSDPNDLLFLFEFNWRIEKGLHPLLNDWATIYESTIEKYNPFHEKFQLEGAITSEINSKLDWSQIKNAWIVLQLALLRLYREEGWSDKWHMLSNRFDQIVSELSSEQKARYSYERCLQYAYNFDIIKIKECLAKWPTDMSMPYWESKRATLIAEFDSTAEAVNILESALKEVRARLNLSPIKNNLSLISMESYIMLLHRCISRADEMRQRLFLFEHNDNYQKRWQNLKLYDCDPWEELKYFEIEMKSVLNIPKTKETIASFDIGRSSTNYKFGSNESFRLAWGYFRFIEEVGLPYHLPHLNVLGKDCFSNAITVISQCSPFTGNVAMIRSGNDKTVNSIYNRVTISTMSRKKVSDHIIRYTALLKHTCNVNKVKEKRDNMTHSLSSTLPEIISRLCCKSTYELRVDILGIIKEIYTSGIIESYTGINELIKRLVGSFSAEEQYYLIPELLEFPIYFDCLEKSDYDPFQYIIVINSFRGAKVDKQVISKLTAQLLEDNYTRTIAYNRLNVLLRYNLLTLQQIKKIAANSWKFLNEKGFPTKIGYHYFAFLGLPHPENIDPIAILREYITNTPFPINSNKEDKSIGFFMGNIPLFSNIAGTYDYRDQYKWSSDEVNKLVSNIIEWWDADKHYLLDKERHFGPSVSDEFKSRFVLLKRIITTIVSVNYKFVKELYISSLDKMVKEIPSYDIYNLEIKASLPLLYKDKNELHIEILKAISSDDNDRILDGINAIIELSSGKNNISDLINAIASNFRCGKKEGLGYSVDCIYQILFHRKNTFSSLDIQNIDLGLLYLASYTVVDYNDTESEANKKINIKRKVARLLVYYKNIINPDSEAYNKWMLIITDDSEFVEVKNEYKNTEAMYIHKEETLKR